MILIYPIHAAVYFIVMGLDIAMFFLIIRLILMWRDVQWLAPFDKVGHGVVEKVTATVGDFISQRSSRRVSKKGSLLISITILTAMRCILVILTRCVV
jgi:hypothetical protein